MLLLPKLTLTTVLVQSCTCPLRSFPPQGQFRLIVTSRFLIEGPQGNILHTGNFHAKFSLQNRLFDNQYLSPYLASVRDGKGKHSVLDRIYLDTASLISTINAPRKVCFPLIYSLILTLNDSRNTLPIIHENPNRFFCICTSGFLITGSCMSRKVSPESIV